MNATTTSAPAPVRLPGLSGPPPRWALQLSVGVMTFSVLSLEVTLLRLFSVMLSYHFVFAIVSIATFSLGAGGIFAVRWERRWPRLRFPVTASLYAAAILGLAIAMIAGPAVLPHLSLRVAFGLATSLAAVPFFFAGLTLATIFRVNAGQSSRLYAADLLGAAAGAVAVVALLDRLGGPATMAMAAAAASVSAALMSAGSPRALRAAAVVLAVSVAALAAARLAPEMTDVTVAWDPDKDMVRYFSNPADRPVVVERRWSSFGRTDLVRSPLSPDEMSLFVDGAAGSNMYNLRALLADPRKRGELLAAFGQYFEFGFLAENERDNALIIGPGGGRDVLVALFGGVRSITAVEVNPDVVALVRKYAAFNGGLYTSMPQVKVVVDEGRRYLRSAPTPFDLIMLALPVTKSSRSIEGYSLTENTLFTVDSMADYLSALTPEGRLVIVAHDDLEIYRITMLTLEAFRRLGVGQADAMKHLYTLSSGHMPTIVIKRGALTRAEADQRHERIHALGYDRGNFFVPFVRQVTQRADEKLDPSLEWRMFDYVMVALADGTISADQLVKKAVYDISAVTDDRPFFYKFERGLPYPFGGLAALILVFFAAVAALPFAGRNAARDRRGTLVPFIAAAPGARIFVAVFATLGVAFMLVEVALFQKLMLLIGRPVESLTTLLFALLLGAGLGSAASARFRSRLEAVAAASSLVAAVLVTVTALAVPRLPPLANMALVARLLLLPLGISMGFAFPLTVRVMRDAGFAEVIPWMWGINGVGSLVGSALAMILGMLAGFSYALYLAAGLYAAVAALELLLRGRLVIRRPTDAAGEWDRGERIQRMLLETRLLSQDPREGRRRWFFDSYFDLVVWYGPLDGAIAGLQLSYSRGRGEHALVWDAGRGFSHYRVDDGEVPGQARMSPLVVSTGAFDAAEVVRRFRAASGRLDAEIRELVLGKLEEYGRRQAEAAARKHDPSRKTRPSGARALEQAGKGELI